MKPPTEEKTTLLRRAWDDYLGFISEELDDMEKERKHDSPGWAALILFELFLFHIVVLMIAGLLLAGAIAIVANVTLVGGLILSAVCSVVGFAIWFVWGMTDPDL
jgi:hypothetical protein